MNVYFKRLFIWQNFLRKLSVKIYQGKIIKMKKERERKTVGAKMHLFIKCGIIVSYK